MILKRFKQFINESNNKKEFVFSFEESCEICNGSGKDKHGECEDCKGAGFYTKWEYDEDTGIEMDFDDDCEECEGNGEVEKDCDECNAEGTLTWFMEFREGEGIFNMYEELGNADQPIQYVDGRIAYNHPEKFPTEIKDIVKFIFNNKNMSIPELVDSVVRYMIENDYYSKYKVDNAMIDLLNDDTKRIISSSNTINKFNL